VSGHPPAARELHRAGARAGGRAACAGQGAADAQANGV